MFKILKTVLLILITFSVFIYATHDFVQRSNPEFCIKCHEMLPEYKTWQASGHRGVKCINCHNNTQLADMVKEKIIKFKNDISGHKKENNLVMLKSTIENKTCQKCHGSDQMKQNPNLIFSHKNHWKKQIKCTACHTGEVHGRVAERGVSKEGFYSSWETVPGESELTTENTKPTMATCLKCHIDRKLLTDCKVCHKIIKKPDDHSKVDWSINHGQQAFTSLKKCEKCHINNFQLSNEYRTIDTVAYSRTTEFCYNCHLKRPIGHLTDWSIVHSSPASLNRTGCLVCHPGNREEINVKQKVVKISCSDCHKLKGRQ